MIDYIKLVIIGVDIQKLLNNHNLEFIRSVSEKTGELDTKTICQYHMCKIKVFDSGMVIFSGSIHKLYNSITSIDAPNKDPKGYNGNQFNYNEIDFARNHLMYLFKVPTEQMKFQNIEFGLNLTTSFNPQDFITGLLLFEMKPFEYRYNEYYAQSLHSQYIIKIYNKSNQYDMALNTLRFEIKVLKMETQNKDVGIAYLSDITHDTLKKATMYLKKQLEKTLYYDNTINEKNLSKHKQNKLKEYCNPRFWQNLTRQQRCKDKKKLNTLIQNNSQNLKSELLQIMEGKRLQFDQLSETFKKLQFDHSSIVSNRTPLILRKCTITGLDISMQKEESILLSHTGLRYLFNVNRKVFDEVKSRFLSTTWAESDLNTQIKEIAHAIRDKKRSQLKKYPKHQYRFNLSPYQPKAVF